MMETRIACSCLLVLAALCARDAIAERKPVLSQITTPHSYYFREMYLPRTTTGPSSIAWMPNGKELIYSMQGKLWRQSINSDLAVQITDGPGYDSQPDVSADGTQVVFSRYDGRGIELNVLQLANLEHQAITQGGDVNVDARWSPDGSQIAFVSTRNGGRFHTFIGRFDGGRFTSEALVEERKSDIVRYYYSPYDHEISPAWLPDGSGLVIVANPETPYGTGSLWLHSDSDSPATLIQREETSWKAQPDVAPDGKRIAFASYLGRQWHQLWVTRLGGEAEPFPMTYGEYDVTEPRWSPDGERIAYIVNEHGNTSIRIQEFVGGKTTDVTANTRHYLQPHANLSLRVTDPSGAAVAARVSVVASDGRSYAPDDAWLHADDGFDRDTDVFERHYFHTQGDATLTLPTGPALVTVWRGLEAQIETRRVDIRDAHDNAVTIVSRPLDLPEAWDGWLSGDVHVHMNYGGTYRNTPAKLVQQARAEDLDVVFNLIVNKEQRVPDIAYFSPEPDSASTADVLLAHTQEYHTSFWGHLGLLGLSSHLLMPDYAAYPYTAAASLYPDNIKIAELAREQNALVGYVHPFDPPAPDPAGNPRLSNALPVNAALGMIDYYEAVGFADPVTSAGVWHRLMNCGLRISAAGGTDAMANYASLRGPLGVNRTYVRTTDRGGDAASRQTAWLNGLQQGHSIATNGPLLSFAVNGKGPGDELRLAAGAHQLEYSGFMRSSVAVNRVEVLLNGEVIDTITTDASGTRADISGAVDINASGWLLLRAWNTASGRETFDVYPYATTTPVWISVGDAPQTSEVDAQYFIDWIERLRENAAAHPDYNSDAEKSEILANLDAASARFESCRDSR